MDPVLILGAGLILWSFAMRKRFPASPVEDKTPITSTFKPPHRPTHNGVDFGAPWGAPCYSIGPGRVSKVHHADDNASGMHVVVVGIGEWAGYAWSYSHLSRIDVQTADLLAPGDVVGAVGNTGHVMSNLPEDAPHRGAHLHFVIMAMPGWTAIDPLPLLP